MVTHSLDEVRTSCTRAMWMDHGVIRADGDVEDVLEQYVSG
jgi:ABC-type polysaccharide/polyol phosphate transport system ATPase subunit